jgi:hypothetical protein
MTEEKVLTPPTSDASDQHEGNLSRVSADRESLLKGGGSVQLTSLY